VENKKKTVTVKNLTTVFPTSRGLIKAANEISFSMSEGSCLALIGESGAGKSVTALSLLRLVPPPGRITGGEIILDNQDLLKLGSAEMRRVRGDDLALVFQDSLSTFNPVRPIGAHICETINAHRRLSNGEAKEIALGKMADMGLPAERVFKSFPFQLSGGMRQRAALAMALSLHPKLLITDEATTSLDVTLQAQVLHYLKKHLQDCCMSVLFISHDLAAAAAVADRVAVIYAGRIVESGPLKEVFQKPLHPYTEALIGSHPSFCSGTLEPIKGSPPDLANLSAGCSFVSRCSKASGICHQIAPVLQEAPTGHQAACHLLIGKVVDDGEVAVS